MILQILFQQASNRWKDFYYIFHESALWWSGTFTNQAWYTKNHILNSNQIDFIIIWKRRLDWARCFHSWKQHQVHILPLDIEHSTMGWKLNWLLLCEDPRSEPFSWISQEISTNPLSIRIKLNRTACLRPVLHRSPGSLFRSYFCRSLPAEHHWVWHSKGKRLMQLKMNNTNYWRRLKCISTRWTVPGSISLATALTAPDFRAAIATAPLPEPKSKTFFPLVMVGLSKMYLTSSFYQKTDEDMAFR